MFRRHDDNGPRPPDGKWPCPSCAVAFLRAPRRGVHERAGAGARGVGWGTLKDQPGAT